MKRAFCLLIIVSLTLSGCLASYYTVLDEPEFVKIEGVKGSLSSEPADVPLDLIKEILVKHATFPEDSEHIYRFSSLIRDILKEHGYAKIAYVTDPNVARVSEKKFGRFTVDGVREVYISCFSPTKIFISVLYFDKNYSVEYNL